MEYHFLERCDIFDILVLHFLSNYRKSLDCFGWVFFLRCRYEIEDFRSEMSPSFDMYVLEVMMLWGKDLLGL